ncbi:MAG: hypothetical protein WDW36_010120 [Sanguina aurantia]
MKCTAGQPGARAQVCDRRGPEGYPPDGVLRQRVVPQAQQRGEGPLRRRRVLGAQGGHQVGHPPSSDQRLLHTHQARSDARMRSR